MQRILGYISCLLWKARFLQPYFTPCILRKSICYFALLTAFFLKEDGDVFDDYDHQMMLHGLGLQNTTTCDSLVAFHKRFKHTLGGKHLLN